MGTLFLTRDNNIAESAATWAIYELVQQYPVTLGLACLVLALTLCIEFGIVNNLPGSVGDRVGNISWIVLGCVFFVLLMPGLHYSYSTDTQRFVRLWKGFK